MVRLWDPIKGKNKRTITGFIDSVSIATFTSNGRQLLISVADQPDILYDLASGKTSPVPAQVQVLDPLAEKMLQEGYMLAGGGSKVVFSPDGNSIAVGHGSIQIWDVKTHQLIKSFSTDKAIAITGMAYSPDGSHLAVITDQGNVFSWNAQTGEQELFISAEALASGQVFYAYGGDELGPGIGAGAMSEQGIAYSSDGKQLILGSGVVIEDWDISSVSKVLTLEQMDLHVDRINNKVYLGRCSASTNIATLNPGGSFYFENTQNGATDMYLARFSLTGTLEWGTFIGGSGDEWLAMSVSTAPDGDVAIINLTGSTNMPLVNPGGTAFFDNTHNGGSWDIYVCRFESTGQMSWSTYYGTSNNEHCQHNLTFDGNGNIIICGVSDGTASPATFNPGGAHFYDGTKDAQGTYCLERHTSDYACSGRNQQPPTP